MELEFHGKFKFETGCSNVQDQMIHLKWLTAAYIIRMIKMCDRQRPSLGHVLRSSFFHIVFHVVSTLWICRRGSQDGSDPVARHHQKVEDGRRGFYSDIRSTENLKKNNAFLFQGI